MKLRHLEIFYAVMTSGSLSRAAEALNISQPAASKALKSAEMKLGFTLFQRVRGKLLPTSEAITLFEKAQSIYQDLDNLRLLADNLARDPRAKITLGCLPSRMGNQPGVDPLSDLPERAGRAQSGRFLYGFPRRQRRA